MAPPSLPTRQLGKNGPQVVALGFGAMGLSAFYGSVESDEERFKVLDRAYEIGATNWDSSDIYGDNEDLIGKWFQRTGKRKEIFLATKFAIALGKDGSHSVRNDSEYIRQAVEKSLRRLQTDYIDLYYCHRLDGKTPVEDIVTTMAELVKEGKIRHIGLSEASASSLRRANAIHQIAAHQIEYSPWTLEIESPSTEVLKVQRELGIATIAYSPLGRGFLTGAYKSRADFEEGDFRLHNPRFSEENFPKNLELVDKIQEIAKKKGATSGQLTLAWLLRQGQDIVPIPGTKKIKYLEENMGALKVEVTDEENKAIRKAIEAVNIVGDRYATDRLSALLRDTPEKK
ncbi:MAG: hypothetical protein GOMPHAMPRED_003477 [Gomphillus americanus]|uniref:NADP-dependent oxidoreductase domain-containing protein n=1 Tax=Gomphillus americanus TaxID=1940652 RepID=A0A8H3ILZ5_9LECA|nr:MAG: hypothetical protein GOMPHAMPRED_003477 [Gomphillus americanus]